jgi:hypothetical protein
MAEEVGPRVGHIAEEEPAGLGKHRCEVGCQVRKADSTSSPGEVADAGTGVKAGGVGGDLLTPHGGGNKRVDSLLHLREELRRRAVEVGLVDGL